MKNIKNLILINKHLGETKIKTVTQEVTGKITIMGACMRSEMWRTMEILNQELSVLVKTSDFFDLKPEDVTMKNQGFKMVQDIENANKAETVIIVANSAYIAGLLAYLQTIMKINIPLHGIVVREGQTLLIHNGDFDKEVRFL